MADPLVVATPAGTYTKITTNVTAGSLHPSEGFRTLGYYVTTRDTGTTPEPTTDVSDSLEMGKDGRSFSMTAAFDLYAMPMGSGAGSVTWYLG